MTFSRRNPVLRLVNLFTENGDYYPTSLCPLTWLFLFTVVFLPVLLLGKAITSFVDLKFGGGLSGWNYPARFVLGVLFIVVAVLVGVIVGITIAEPIFGISLLIFIGAIIGIIVFYIWWTETGKYKYGRAGVDSDEPSMVVEMARSIFSKACPRITYRD